MPIINGFKEKLRLQQQEQQTEQTNKLDQAGTKSRATAAVASKEHHQQQQQQQQQTNRAEKLIMAIEKFSVIVFLFSFLTFNLVYWIDIFQTVSEQ